MKTRRSYLKRKGRRRLSQTNQARWSRKMVRMGRCRICGEKRTARSRFLCDKHQDIANAYMRYRRARERGEISTNFSSAPLDIQSEVSKNDQVAQ